jgi:hypothetical protein
VAEAAWTVFLAIATRDVALVLELGIAAEVFVLVVVAGTLLVPYRSSAAFVRPQCSHRPNQSSTAAQPTTSLLLSRAFLPVWIASVLAAATARSQPNPVSLVAWWSACWAALRRVIECRDSLRAVVVTPAFEELLLRWLPLHWLCLRGCSRRLAAVTSALLFALSHIAVRSADHMASPTTLLAILWQTLSAYAFGWAMARWTLAPVRGFPPMPLMAVCAHAASNAAVIIAGNTALTAESAWARQWDEDRLSLVRTWALKYGSLVAAAFFAP